MVFSKIKTYGELVMFSHTIFSLPFVLIATFIAAKGLPSFWVSFWILVALISARTAANAINRIVDKDIDAKNPRTAKRHMPAGLVSTKEAFGLAFACLALLVIAAFKLNPMCVLLLPIPVFLFFIYSYTKRFTWACHIILGIACGGAPVGAWIAITGRISWTAIVLGAIVTLWIAGFDIIYGAQDVDFDNREKLYSIPAVFGIRNGLIVSALFHLATILLLGYLGYLTHLHWLYFTGAAIAAGLLIYEHLIVSPTNLTNVSIASYSINQIVSTILLIFTTADIFLL